MSVSADGTLTQDYRPLGILEYIHEILSGEIQSRNIRDRLALAKELDVQ